jgi:uncharacterized protein (UPF0332 family)
LTPKYLGELRASLRANRDEWECRIEKCGRRIVSAVTFREVSRSACKDTGTVLLSVIGHYYAIYHIAIAALYFDVNTKPDELKKMKHQNLRRLVQERLVNNKLLPKRVMRKLRELRDLREAANYAFGGKERTDKIQFWKIVPGLYRKERKAFEACIRFIHEVGAEVDEAFDMKNRLGIWIDDGIGNDAFTNYLSRRDQALVEKYLEKNGFVA